MKHYWRLETGTSAAWPRLNIPSGQKQAASRENKPSRAQPAASIEGVNGISWNTIFKEGAFYFSLLKVPTRALLLN